MQCLVWDLLLQTIMQSVQCGMCCYILYHSLFGVFVEFVVTHCPTLVFLCRICCYILYNQFRIFFFWIEFVVRDYHIVGLVILCCICCYRWCNTSTLVFLYGFSCYTQSYCQSSVLCEMWRGIQQVSLHYSANSMSCVRLLQTVSYN